MYKWICVHVSYNIVHMDNRIYVYTLTIFDIPSAFQLSFKIWFWVYNYTMWFAVLVENMISNCDLTRQFYFNCYLVCNCGAIYLYIKNICSVHMYTLKLMYICTLWYICMCTIWTLRCYYCILIKQIKLFK